MPLVRTHDLPVAERFAYWHELTGRMVAPVETRSDHAPDFRASARVVDLGTVQVTAAACPSYEAFRTRRLIRRFDPELYQLSLNLRGRSGLSQDRRDVSLGVGDFVLYDTSRPFRGWAVPAGRHALGMLVAFPRALLPAPVGLEKLMVAPLSGTTGIGALLTQFLGTLVQQGAEHTAADAARLSTVVLDLVTTFLAHELQADQAVPPDVHRRALFLRVQAFVDGRLGDPALSPRTIAAAHHVSTRYMHKLFEDHGLTVSGWIRQRRLDRCRRDLADPALLSRPVYAVGARWGFIDASHFSRAFRRAYGVSPAAYRRMVHQPGAPGGSGEDAATGPKSEAPESVRPGSRTLRSGPTSW